MIEYKTVSLADQVYDTLEYNILTGVYACGEIISETRLSEELGVSRTPIREAMSRLQHEKLIKESPNGTVVVGVTEKDVKDLFEVKRRIEVIATRRAAENISPEGLKALKDNIEQQEFFAQKGDAIKVRDLDTEFHDIIYKECGSTTFESHPFADSPQDDEVQADIPGEVEADHGFSGGAQGALQRHCGKGWR